MSEKKPTILERVKNKLNPVIREVNRVGRIVGDAIVVQKAISTLRNNVRRNPNA